MYRCMATPPTPARRRKVITGEKAPVEDTVGIMKKVFEGMKKETKIKKRPEELKIKKPEEFFKVRKVS